MADPATRFFVRYHHSRQAGTLALLTMDNGADHRKPNVFDGAALDSLHRALDEVAGASDLRGLLLTGKPFAFAAGADTNEFVGISAEQARTASEAGHAAFSRLSELEVPTLAAINGVCLGGGLEIALHCDYRTVSDAARAIAFPEVFLGIVPAWGGTQLAPRLVGPEQALQVMVANALDRNKMLTPVEAVERGFADRLLPAVDLLDESVALLERIVTGEERIVRSPPDMSSFEEALAAARQTADQRTHGATPAPYRAIDLVGFAAGGHELADGRHAEIDALAELLPARPAQASIYAFDLTQRRVRKQPWRPEAEAREPRRTAVVGAGLMGSQLGALLLQRLEVPLVMKDVDAGVLDGARQRIEGELDKRVARGRMAQPKADFLKTLVTYSLDDDALAGCDLVIEAVVEVLDVKRKVLADVERVVEPEAILATNTSSLSVGDMAAGLARPERMVGLHFFNPVAVMPLVEVVDAPATDAATLASAFEVAKRLGKSAVPCADTTGFVVNRVLFRWVDECLAAANAGTSFADIDASQKALGLPMGPFELLGLVGLKVAAHVAEVMHGAFPDRFRLDDNVRLLGEVDLPGIYDWDRGQMPFEQIAQAWNVDPDGRPWSHEELQTRVMEAVADEVGTMLDEGVVADARDIDTCMLLGAGWPFFMGGICPYLDDEGISERLLGRRLVSRDDAAVRTS